MRHFVWTVILLTIASVGLAQVDHEVQRMNLEVDRLITKNWISDAMRLAEKAVQQAESTLDETDPEFIEALTNLAIVSLGKGDSARALTLYDRVLRIQQRTLGPEHPDLAGPVGDLASVHRTTRSFEQAELLYLRALELHEKNLPPDDPELVAPLNSLAGLYQMQGEYEQARLLLERATAIQEKQLGPDHPALVEPLRFMSTIHLTQKNKTQARELSERARLIEIKHSRRVALADPQRGAIGITILINPTTGGAIGIGKGRMFAAKVYFVRTDAQVDNYVVGSSVRPNYSWDEQNTLTRRTTDFIESNYNHHADVYLLNAEPGRYVAVGALLIHSETGRTIAYPGVFSTELSGRTEVTVAAGQMVHMGEFQALIHPPPDATQRFLFDYFAPAAVPEIEAPGFGFVHYQRDAKCIKLESYKRAGKSEGAFWGRTRKSLKKDTTWLDRIPGKDELPESGPVELSDSARASQRALQELTSGDHVTAAEFAEKAVAICESIPEAPRPCLAPALGNLADILTLKKERARAKLLYERALELRQKELGPQHPAVAYSLKALAGWNIASGEFEKAEELEMRALAIFEQDPGGDTLAVADSLHSLAQLREKANDAAAAQEMMERALRIREDILGWTHPTVASLLECLARQSFAQGDFSRAAELNQRAMVIRERFVGPSHRDVAGPVYHLGRATHELGNHDQAVKHFERAILIQSEVFGVLSQETIDSTFALASAYEELGNLAKAGPTRDRANRLCQQKAMADLDAIGVAFMDYANANRGFPVASDIESLKDQLHPVYILNMPVRDGWGNPYGVESSARTFTLKSLGQDGRANPHAGGQTSGFVADIVFFDGSFTQWPEAL